MLSGIGAIMDRAFDLLVRYRGAVAWCLLPAIVLRFISLVLFPGSLHLTFASEEQTNDYLRKWSLYGSAIIIASFSLWFCSAALMVGVRRVIAGDSTRPISWLLHSWRRMPALLGTFVPFAILRISMISARTQDGTVELKTMAAYEAAGVLIGLLLLPPVSMVLTGVMLENLSVGNSLLVLFRTCLSAGRFRKFLAVSAAMILINIAVDLVLTVVFEFVALKVPSAPLAWQVVWSILEPTTIAYTTFIVAVAWLSGYIGPRTQAAPKTSD